MAKKAHHQNQAIQSEPAVQLTETPSFNSLLELAASLPHLRREAAFALAPAVQNLIQTKTRDIQQIEHTLDRLLDCAGVPEGLALFKALCRHLYTIDPSVAVFHVNAYRETWDYEPA